MVHFFSQHSSAGCELGGRAHALLTFSPRPPLPGSLVAQTVKSPPAMQETRVGSQGWKDPLEKRMATHYSILAWRTRSLVGYSPWGHKESDKTEQLTLSLLSPPARKYINHSILKPKGNEDLIPNPSFQTPTNIHSSL